MNKLIMIRLSMVHLYVYACARVCVVVCACVKLKCKDHIQRKCIQLIKVWTIKVWTINSLLRMLYITISFSFSNMLNLLFPTSIVISFVAICRYYSTVLWLPVEV